VDALLGLVVVVFSVLLVVPGIELALLVVLLEIVEVAHLKLLVREKLEGVLVHVLWVEALVVLVHRVWVVVLLVHGHEILRPRLLLESTSAILIGVE
jgi:hypothetical protein